MSSSNSDYEAFIQLKNKAIATVQAEEKALEKKLADGIAALKKSVAAEVKAVQKKYKSLGVEPKGEAKKKTSVKVSDDEIKKVLDLLFAKSKEIKSTAIFAAIKINRDRFNKFIEDNGSYMTFKGEKKSRVYFKR